ncbi:MAG TPA: PQQ-binding-like beta-propeller repeat protein [Verrucomicrobiae bacterium]|nr:PQQ-binding-like beta-propeller repeat protein [Verrucomicrobiae bacterium]
MKASRVVAALTFIASIAAIAAEAQEWTRFRGPNGSGISDAKTIPTQWSASDINWKVALPGVGHSSPVLWGEKVFVTSYDEKAGKFYVLCLSMADGSMRWEKEFSLTRSSKHALNSFATATPTVDAQRVYVCRTEPAQVILSALTHDGNQVWEKDLGPFEAQHGSGTSPILHDGMVVLANEQAGESFLIALDARTGDTRWKTPRKSGSGSYSTPCVYEPTSGTAQLIFNSEVHGISGVAPDTGKVLWEFDRAFDKRSVSSPVLAGDFIIGSCGSGGGGNYVVAVRPGEIASGRKPERGYEVRRSAPYVPTSICVGDWLYLWSDGGILSRVNAKTGEVKWQERAGGNFYGSPVLAGERLFCVSTTGEVVVVPVGEKFEVLARNQLNEPTHSTPAIAGGRMYIHTSGHLVSVGGKARAVTE